jgi:hypothetical protein
VPLRTREERGTARGQELDVSLGGKIRDEDVGRHLVRKEESTWKGRKYDRGWAGCSYNTTCHSHHQLASGQQILQFFLTSGFQTAPILV